MKNSELIKVLSTYLMEDGDMDVVLPQCGEDELGENIDWLADISCIEIHVVDDGTRVLSIF